jgi:hypothetical protein
VKVLGRRFAALLINPKSIFLRFSKFIVNPQYGHLTWGIFSPKLKGAIDYKKVSVKRTSVATQKSKKFL